MGGRSQSTTAQNQRIFSDEHVLRLGKHILPHVARLFIISTFMEDGIKMWFHWTSQRDNMNATLGCGWYLATLFVVVKMIGQLTSCVLILIRREVNIACAILLGIVVLQTVAYDIFLDVRFLKRNLTLIGGLIILLAEFTVEDRSLFAGLPSTGTNTQRTYMRLSGRILLVLGLLTLIRFMRLSGRIILVLMLFTLIRFDLSFVTTVVNIAVTALVVLNAIDYKKNIGSLIILTFLTAMNLYLNAWWNVASDSSLRDFLKCDFFQTLSVIGVFLLA